MPPEDRVRLLHMRDALAAVQRMAGKRIRADLDTDEMLRLALTRAIEIVGEAAGRVSEPTRREAPAIPWQQLASMRNRLIHAYFDVNLDILWTTATISVSALTPQIEELLET